MAKRLFDLVVASIGLLLFAPLMFLIAVAVRLDSAGPAIFQQVRVGRSGRRFYLLKFRSMISDAPQGGPLLTVAGDPRVTRVGARLRSSKLDELPQLLNVLMGDMSLVGPRPEVPRYVAMYPPEIRELVLSVKPGITDEASIAFRDESLLLAAACDPGAFYVAEVLPRKLEYYARYARERTFWGDIGILWRTVLIVFLHASTQPAASASTKK
jgi:lipopolysaccharide/colanic/teichoic acid biosynthesis glycosyltransferase